MPPQHEFLPDNRRNQILVIVTLLVATSLAYSNSFAGPFIFDDTASIEYNRTIRQLWPIWDVLRPPTGDTVGGRPFLNLTFALNYAIGGFSVFGYHLFNLVIHCLAGLTLFGIMRRTLRLVKLEAESLLLAAAITLVWLLHPLQTESVTYMVQRAESLVSLCYLLSLYSFLRLVDAPAQRRWLAVAGIASAIGMLCKEVMVTAPFTILLFDRVFVSGSFRSAVQRHRRFHLASFVTVIIFLVITTRMHGRGITAGFDTPITVASYAATQAWAVLRYIRLTFWPDPLIFDYGRAANVAIESRLPQLAGIVGLLLLTGLLLRIRPKIGFLAAAFFIILAPSSSLIPIRTQAIAEHRMYLALAPLLAITIIPLRHALGRWTPAFCVAWSALLGYLTFQRNVDYQSHLAMWRDNVKKLPTSARGHFNLGGALTAVGNKDEAFLEFREAARLDPGHTPDAYTRALVMLNEMDTATDSTAYRKAVMTMPESAELHLTLARILTYLDRFAEAVMQFQIALVITPMDAVAHNEMGRALGNLGRAEEAIGQFEAALQINPGFTEARSNLELAKQMRDSRKP